MDDLKQKNLGLVEQHRHEKNKKLTWMNERQRKEISTYLTTGILFFYAMLYLFSTSKNLVGGDLCRGTLHATYLRVR